MEEEQKKENALVEVKDRALKRRNKTTLPKVVDGAKRIGKILGYSGAAFAGLMAVAVGSTPVEVIGAVGGIRAAYGAILNTLYRTEEGLSFASKKRGDEMQICQSSLLDLGLKMRGYTKGEKGGMMALQTLIGFSRWKENLRDSVYEVGENGEKIYSQKVSTVTHGINIKTMEALETLGYIKIDNLEDKFEPSIVGKMLGKEPEEKQVLLVFAKLGFGNYDDLMKMAKAGLTGNKEALDKMKKKKQKITFRMTDKPINFEELYNTFSDLSQVEDANQRVALRRLAVVFSHKQGILSRKNIDIEQDRFGRDVLKFGTKQPFGRRIERSAKIQDIQQEEKSALRDRVREDVDVQEAIDRVNTKNQSQETQSRKQEQR